MSSSSVRDPFASLLAYLVYGADLIFLYTFGVWCNPHIFIDILVLDVWCGQYHAGHLYFPAPLPGAQFAGWPGSNSQFFKWNKSKSARPLGKSPTMTLFFCLSSSSISPLLLSLLFFCLSYSSVSPLLSLIFFCLSSSSSLPLIVRVWHVAGAYCKKPTHERGVHVHLLQTLTQH